MVAELQSLAEQKAEQLTANAELQRRLAALLASRRWTLRHAEAHVLFPGSDHVETLAVLDVAP